MGNISALPTNSSDYTQTVTDYVGNMIYQNGSLKEILTPEGYIENGVYYYYLQDHQGNNRVVINSSGAVQEYSHYYPDGMRYIPESSTNAAAIPYRYNNKEFEAMNGLNQYDYGARRKLAWGGWTTRDMLCEKKPWMSPYAYCLDNPLRFIDPDGKDEWEVDRSGHVKRVKKNDKHVLYALNDKGKRNGNSLSLKDDKMFDALSKVGKNDVSKFTGGKSKEGDMMKTFKFLADNNKVEWQISKFSMDGKTDFVLNTEHNTIYSPSSEKLGYSDDNLEGFIHSHPDITKAGEVSSMGQFYKEGNVYSNTGDNGIKIRSLSNSNNYFYGTYFPESGHLYEVNGYKPPTLLKTVDDESDLDVEPLK